MRTWKGMVGVVMAGLLATAMGCGAEGKHLFILSGQSNMVGLDPEVSFTPRVAAALGAENIIVVKDAQGGQPIRRWDRDWKSDKGRKFANNGDLYGRLMKSVREATAGKEIASATFVWMQGEADARTRNGRVYAASLKRLVAQLRADLGQEDMNVVIGRLSDFDLGNKKYAHWTKVREAQVAVAEADPRGAWVDTDDLNQDGGGHGLHLTEEGYRILGERFAAKALALLRK